MTEDTNKQEKREVTFSPDDLPPGATLSFGQDGELVVKNRKYRRQKMSLFKKSSQLRKKKPRKKKK